jgi:hypothetical protein
LAPGLLVRDQADKSRYSEFDSAAESAILAYLSERPEACDSLRGIAEWWITQYTIRFGVETVARALQRLADAGVLECVECRPEPLYRLKTAATGSQ